MVSFKYQRLSLVNCQMQVVDKSYTAVLYIYRTKFHTDAVIVAIVIKQASEKFKLETITMTTCNFCYVRTYHYLCVFHA